jgi:response regulator RpfG family c-di-GMP phosphodiesterase
MPGINGLEFLERAREIAPESTRILITAFPDLKVATEAIEEAGISNYFVKPFDPGQLLDAVQVALHGHASRHLVERNIRKAFHSAEGDRPPSSP